MRKLAITVCGLLSTTVAVLFVVSGWYKISFCLPCCGRPGITIYHGCVIYLGRGWLGWTVMVEQFSLDWSVDWNYWSTDVYVFVPLYVPFAIFAFATGILWWPGRKRYKNGYCQNCGYDLRGNVSGVCPECGISAGGAERIRV